MFNVDMQGPFSG